MSLGTLSAIFSKIYMAVQTIEPKGAGSAFLSGIGWLGQWVWQGICLGIYNLVRWLLALVDFMQYFVQKLIGLDYWLNRTRYTLEGAIEADIIFGFIYSDTVQKVFRALVAVFFVLLIIFTIYAIIKNEWEHINGTGQGGKFGDGVGNSKTKIFKHSMKAIALVFIFPLVLMIGLLSANAILASLIKALNIGTSSTLGGQLFQIASQNANKFEKYAHDTEGRAAVADEVTFYIKDHRYVSMSPGPSDLVYQVDTYEDYLNAINNGATKYTVYSIFDHVNIGGIGGFNDTNTFDGFIAKLTKTKTKKKETTQEPFFVLVHADGKGGKNTPEGMYYYLKCVLQVPIVDKSESQGFEGHDKAITNQMVYHIGRGSDKNCYIQNLDLTQFSGGDAVCEAAWNTWNYASIYEQLRPFEEAEGYAITRGSSGILGSAGLTDITNAKIMYNSPLFSTYFDGGQFGFVATQSEYLVMAEVIDFICQNNLRLHILDITSSLITWSGYNGYRVDSKWVNTGNLIDGAYTPLQNPARPFVISYSDACNETEMGNVLYFGEQVGYGNELNGAKYIMCIKVEGATDASGNPINSTYIPLVNNRTYVSPDLKSYTFKSSYYASSYNGVVLAKGFLDSGATNAYRGEPTYFISGEKDEESEDGALKHGEDRNDKPYYYDIKYEATFSQYLTDGDYVVHDNYKVQSFDVLSSSSEYSYEARTIDSTPSKHEYNIYKVPNEGPESITTPTEDLMRNVSIQMIGPGDDIRIATYEGVMNSNNYLFSYTVNSQQRFFFIQTNDTGKVSILQYATIIGERNYWEVANYTESIRTLTYTYNIKYDYTNLEDNSKSEYGEEIATGVTANQFVYSGRYGEDNNDDGKGDYSLFSTMDMWSIQGNIQKTMYVSVVFKTTGTNLVSVDVHNNKNPNLIFVKPYVSSKSNKFEDANVCSTAMLKFVFYDYYTAAIGDSITNCHLESFKTDGTYEGAASEPDPNAKNYDEWVFTCKVDSNQFDFGDTFMHLYDGKTYVATVYRANRTSIDGPGELINSTRVLYEDNYYYNIRTQNRFANRGAATGRYEDALSSTVISCLRANRSFVFMDIDFGLASLFEWRLHWEFFFNKIEREWQGHQIYITQGVQFDYFFEDTVVAGQRYGSSLITYYIPGKISYWIIVIASALMIKVLGTAIWGVIKRIYEITLYFLAAPAVASTIPLDGGQKFTSSIQQPLVSKILGTYGVMLGLNVFFILLYPVKEMSQIFTPADIATSNSYFLKNFFSIFGREFQAKMLNLYVYILFVLVAFTMISTLPGVISKMVGGEDLKASGEQTKKQAMSDVKSATDMASGKSLMDAAGGAKKAVTESAPWQMGKKIVGGAKDLKERFSKGVTEDEGAVEGGSSDGKATESEREDEEGAEGEEEAPQMDPARQELQNKIDSEVMAATAGEDGEGGMTYEEAMASDDQTVREKAQQAKAAVEQEVMQSGSDEEKAALEAMKAEESAEAESQAEATAEQQFTQDAQQMAQELGGESAEMQANTARQMMQNGGKEGNQIFNIVVQASLEPGEKGEINKNKEAAVLSVMNDAEKEAYNNASDEEKAAMLDSYGAEVVTGEDGKQSLVVGKKDENGKFDPANGTAVSDSVADGILNQDFSNEQINNAIGKTDKEGNLTAESAGAQAMVASAMAGNIAMAINFDDAGNDSIASQVIDNVLTNPEDEQNGKVIDKAIMEYMNANPEMKGMFQKVSGLSDEQMQDEGNILKSIGDLRKGGNIDVLGITPDKYQGFVAGALQTSVQDGSFKLSAWDLYKSSASASDVQNYVDKATESGMIRKNDEAELESEKSLEIMNKLENEKVAGAIGVDLSSLAKEKGVEVKDLTAKDIQDGIDAKVKQNAVEAAAKEGKDFDSLDEAEKQKYLDDSNKGLDGARAKAKGEMLFAAFAENPNGNSDAVQQMFKAYAGINSIKAAGEINSAVDEATLNNLKLQGNSSTDIAMAVKLAQLQGKDLNFENLSSTITAMQNNPNMLNGQFLEVMQNAEGGDISKAYAVLGGGVAVSEEELNNLSNKVANNGVMALGQDEVMYALAVGSDEYQNFKNLSPEQKKEAIANMKANTSEEELAKLQNQTTELSGMSAYEVNAILNGKTRQEAFADLREDTKKRNAINEIMESGDVSIEEIMNASGDLSESDKAYVEKMYAQRMQLVSEDDKKQAEFDAENAIIDEAVGTKGSSNAERYAAIVGGSSAQAEFGQEVDKQLDTQIREMFESKDLSKKKKEFLKNNQGITEDEFYNVVKVSMTGTDAEKEALRTKGLIFKDADGNLEELTNQNKKAGQFDNYISSMLGKDVDLSAKKSEIEHSVVVGAAKESVEDFEFRVSKETSSNIEKRNMELISQGADERAFAVADRLQGNSKVMKEAEELYKSTHNGASLAAADEYERAAFLYTNFEDRLSQNELTVINADYSISEGNKDSIFSKLSDDKDKFSNMYAYISSYDGDERGNEIARGLKEQVVTAEYERKKGDISIIHDPEKMDEITRKKYDFNKGILQQEMRNNPDVVGNIFKNSTLLGEDAMIMDIAKKQGLNVELKNGQFTLDGKNIETNQLKAQLDNNKIADYMNSHEKDKDKLLALGAQNMMVALDGETQNIKKTEAVLGNAYLRNQVTNETLKSSGLVTENGMLDNAKIKELIKQMLQSEGKENQANDEYINKNFSKLKTELALHDLSNGTVGEKKADAFIGAIATLEKDKDNNKLFINNLNREVTSIINPANYDPNSSSQKFFEKRSISEFSATGKDGIFNIDDAISKFNNPNFTGFTKEGVVIAARDNSQNSFVNLDKGDLKANNQNWLLYQSAKNDASVQKALKGKELNYENVMAHLNSNGDVKAKHQDLVYAGAILDRAKHDDGYAKKLKEDYQLIIGKNDTAESVMEKMNSNRQIKKIKSEAKGIVKEGFLVDSVNNGSEEDKARIKSALVSDDELLKHAEKQGLTIDTASENFNSHLIAAAQNDDYIKGKLGDKINDKQAVADFLNSNTKVKAKMVEKAKASMIRTGSTGNKEFDANTSEMFNTILSDKGLYADGQLSEEAVDNYFSGMSSERGKIAKVKRYVRFKKGATEAAIDGGLQNISEKAQSMVSFVKGIDLRKKSTKEATKKIAGEINSSDEKKQEAKKNLILNNSSVKNAIKSNIEISNSDVIESAQELGIELDESGIDNIRTNNPNLYNKIVSKAKDKKFEQIKTSIEQNPSTISKYEDILKNKGFVDESGNVTEKAISKSQKSEIKKYKKAKFHENVQGKVSAVKNAFDNYTSMIKLKTGKYGGKTVNNIEMFKMLESDASMRDEAKSAIEAEGKTYSYDTAMEYLEKNKGKRTELKNKVRIAEAKSVMMQNASSDKDKASIQSMTDEEVESKLQQDKNIKKQVNKRLKSKNTDRIAERVRGNDSLMREVNSSLVSDEGIEEFIRSAKPKIDISDADIVAEARKDSSVMAKLGANASDFDIRAHLAGNAKDKARLTQKAKISKVRTNADLKAQFNNHRVDDNSIIEYVAKNNIDLGEVSKNDLIKGARKDASLMKDINRKFGRKATDADIYQYLQDKNNAEDKNYLVASLNVAKARQNSGLMADIVKHEAAKSKDDISNGQIGRYFSGKKNNNNEHVRYRRTQKPIEEQFGYKMKRGLVYAGSSAKGIGKFALGLTGVPDAVKAANGKKGIKAVGAGALGFVTNAGIAKGVKFALKGKSDKWGQGGLSKTAVVGANAVVFKTAKKLPAMCTQYENWNRVLNHKISQVKQDTTLTRKQKEEQIQIFESQKIYLQKPAAYKNMSASEQNAFDLNQDKLKRQAYTDKSLADYIKTLERVRLGKPEKLGISGVFTQLVKPITERRQNHLHEYNHMHQTLNRFNATAAMRNKEQDYGENFEQMARNFLSRKRYFDMMKRYKLKGLVQYQQMSAAQKEKERQRREAALAAQLARLNRIVAKKVARDNKVNPKSFLQERGLVSEIPRYKDGSAKFRTVENALPTVGLASRRSQLKHGPRSQAEVVQIQNQALNIDKAMNEFITLSSQFKGSSAEFSAMVKKELAKYGPYIQKIYDKNKGHLGIGALINSPVAVQQRKIMEGLKDELTQLRKRATANGKISASREINNYFVGKTYTGATTKGELSLHRQTAEDLNRIVKLIKEQRGHVSYDSLTKRLGSTYMSAFNMDNSKISSKSEETKKNMLESYFEKKLNEALKQIHNDTKFKADKINLEKLNGRRVNKSEIDHSRRSDTMANAMKTADNPVYQRILRDVNSSSERVRNESFKLSELNNALRNMQSMPRTPKNLNEIIKIEKAIRQTQNNLTKAKSVLAGYQNTRAEYERAFASTQIKQAKSTTKNLAYNRSHTSVFDKYEFRNSDGNAISKYSTDGKQVEMLVSRYIQNYRQSIESMVKKMVNSEDSAIKSYINKMSKKFSDDFGKNMSFAREVKDELSRKIEELKNSTKRGDRELKETLESNLKLLTQSEQSLERSLRSMGVNISSIRLKNK